MSQPKVVAEDVRRVRAPNPSALTFTGTNSYIVGTGRVAVIDPGPDVPDHLDALLAALAPGETVQTILVTHAHLDHSPLSRRLSEATGAVVCAGGRATDGRSPAMAALAASGLAGGGEGLDHTFTPDETLADGDVIEGGTWRLEAVATPGHLGAHMAFALGTTLFTGDHVMGWATTLVSPPDGDMGAYMRSLDRLAARPAQLFLPGHGEPVTAPAERLADLKAHRLSREAAILAALGAEPKTAETLAWAIYTDIAPVLIPAATRNVLAHLIDLTERNLAQPIGPLGIDTAFRTP